MNNNSEAIIILCSHLCGGEDIKPLEPSEWAKTAEILVHNKLEPKDLLLFSNDDFQKILSLNEDQIFRYKKLVKRSASIAFEIEKYERLGIKLITRADLKYPGKIKKKLGKNCPPLFYYAGNLDLLEGDYIGMVGSRKIEQCDIDFTGRMVDLAIKNKYGIISGGAKGIDSTARNKALDGNANVIEFVADALIRKIKNQTELNAIREGKMLVLSASKPDAGFSVGAAMARNKYIYTSSYGTIVVKSDLNEGGTWAGAIESLKNEYCPTFCWNNSVYKGNLALIYKGALPINEPWDMEDGDFSGCIKNQKGSYQMTIFDIKK